MKFAAPHWLFGTAIALVLALLLVAGGFLLVRSVRRFGDEKLVTDLLTGRPGGRRVLKGGLLVVAVALAFVALAKPQYGRGTRIIPATNLDVVIVLDYSKSMYARDIAPSRTLRAKSEVTRLIQDLPGARFGAVAFAGQPMAFPITSDGGAIAQFFKQLAPNDMPEGGTAIGRALEAARELFSRDPLSKKHKKVALLVTDGEDLEGDPVAAAEALAQAEIQVHVVQVGGRTPEPIPEVNDVGQVVGWRRTEDGKVLTTELSAEGEAQLAKIAEVSGGHIVRSGDGKTGIEVVAKRLRQLMTDELSERVETIYADVYFYPLALALLLVVIETFVNETRPRARPAVLPPPPARRRRRRKSAAAVATGLLASVLLLTACSQERRELFTRHAPPVDDAIAALDAGDAGAAVELLTQYLSTGKCDNGAIGTPARVRDLPNASFDLGLALFQLAERYGQRFGEEPPVRDGGADPAEMQAASQRDSEVDCALRIVRTVANNASLAPELRARAAYLAGNLEFLRGDYRSAVDHYNAALRLVPGLAPDAGDTVGRDAAHNRAIALARLTEQEKKKPDAGPDAGTPDGGPDGGPPDAGQDSEPDAGQQEPDGGQNDDGGAPDAGPQDSPDAGPPEQPDAGADGNAPQPKPEEQQQPPAPKPQNAQKNERLLDELEQAPTFQEHQARERAGMGRVRLRMEDK